MKLRWYVETNLLTDAMLKEEAERTNDPTQRHKKRLEGTTEPVLQYFEMWETDPDEGYWVDVPIHVEVLTPYHPPGEIT